MMAFEAKLKKEGDFSKWLPYLLLSPDDEENLKQACNALGHSKQPVGSPMDPFLLSTCCDINSENSIRVNKRSISLSLSGIFPSPDPVFHFLLDFIQYYACQSIVIIVEHSDLASEFQIKQK